MLDVQRYRGAVYRDEIQFTRKVMWTHMIVGAVVVALFLFHEVFAWFGGAMVWYALTLLAMYGFMTEVRACRWVLAALFAAAAGVGVYFVNRVVPHLEVPAGALMPRAFIPIWMGLGSLVYGLTALLLLCSRKVRRAGSVGFSLW